MFCIQIFDTTTEDFSNIIMSVERFDALLELVGPRIAKKSPTSGLQFQLNSDCLVCSGTCIFHKFSISKHIISKVYQNVLFQRKSSCCIFATKKIYGNK